MNTGVRTAELGSTSAPEHTFRLAVKCIIGGFNELRTKNNRAEISSAAVMFFSQTVSVN